MRNGAHSKCTGSKRDMVLFHRDTGARGPEAQAMYDQYMNIKMPNLWEECLQPPPQPIRPLPRRSPLEKLYPSRSSHKRSRSPGQAPPTKKARSDVKPLPTKPPMDDFDGYVDPDIQICEPVEEKFAPMDPTWKDVSFPPPVKVQSTLSDSESSDEEWEEVGDVPLPNKSGPKSVVVKVNKSSAENNKVSNSKTELNLGSRKDSNKREAVNKENTTDKINTSNRKSKSETVKATAKTEKDSKRKNDNKAKDSDGKRAGQTGRLINKTEQESKVKNREDKNEGQSESVTVSENKAKDRKDKKEEQKERLKVSENQTDSENSEGKTERLTVNEIKDSEDKYETPTEILKTSSSRVNEISDGSDYKKESEHMEAVGDVSDTDDLDLCGNNNIETNFSEEELILINSHYDENLYHNLLRFNTKFVYPGATQPKERQESKPDPYVEAAVLKAFQTMQEIQESRVILCIGGQNFHTSKVTLRADPDSIFAKMLRKDSPMRPQGRVYFFDRDPSHFRFVLNYLRNGGHLDVSTLPHEKRYLLELLAEVKFYNLEGLQEIIRERLFQITKSRKF